MVFTLIFILQIVITAKVGKNNLGDIAVDDISLTHGTCPSKTENYALKILQLMHQQLKQHSILSIKLHLK